MWYTRDLIIRPVRIMGVGEDVWVNSESDDGDEYFEPCLRYDKLASFLSKKESGMQHNFWSLVKL